MLKDVTLGQFFPGQTPIHKLDPRTKLVLVIVYIVALFLAKWFVSYAVIAAFLALVIAMSRIRLKVVLKNLKPLLFIILLTAVLNLFYGQGEPIAQFWIFKITKSGIQNAVFMVLRISLLVAGTFMLTYTTSPIALTDGLESLLSPLKKLHAPVHELSMMMTIALRFIPTLIDETGNRSFKMKNTVKYYSDGVMGSRGEFGMTGYAETKDLKIGKGSFSVSAWVRLDKKTLTEDCCVCGNLDRSGKHGRKNGFAFIESIFNCRKCLCPY